MGERGVDSYKQLIALDVLVVILCVCILCCTIYVGMEDSVSVEHMKMGPSLSAREC